MKRFIIFAICLVLLFPAVFCFAQEGEQEDAHEGTLVIRKALQKRKNYTAITAYLIEDVLEVEVIATMRGEKPNIYDVLFIGSGVGRISPKERQTIVAKVDDKELIFNTEKKEAGFIRFTKKEREKKLKGRLTKEMVKFKLPLDKIKENKRYTIKIKIESLQRPGQFKKYEFELEDLHEAVKAEQQTVKSIE